EGSDDDEKHEGVAADGVEHEEGDGVEGRVLDVTGEVAEEESIHHHDGEDGPEGQLGKDVFDADAGERGELLEGGGEVEDLMDDGQTLGDERADGLGGGGIVFAFTGGAAGLRDRTEGFSP